MKSRFGVVWKLRLMRIFKDFEEDNKWSFGQLFLGKCVHPPPRAYCFCSAGGPRKIENSMATATLAAHGNFGKMIRWTLSYIGSK